MGELIKWKCKCGYKKVIDEDIGYLEYELDPEKEKVWTISALCPGCSEVIGINRDDKHPTCTKCNGNKIIPYSNPCLYKGDPEKFQDSKAINTDDEDDDELMDIEELLNEKYYDEKGNFLKNIKEPDLTETENKDKNDEENEDDSFDIESLLEGDNLDDEYDEKLGDENYYLCPKCNQFLMERFNAGFWD